MYDNPPLFWSQPVNVNLYTVGKQKWLPSANLSARSHRGSSKQVQSHTSTEYVLGSGNLVEHGESQIGAISIKEWQTKKMKENAMKARSRTNK
jgi:hypothetical protein